MPSSRKFTAAFARAITITLLALLTGTGSARANLLCAQALKNRSTQLVQAIQSLGFKQTIKPNLPLTLDAIDHIVDIIEVKNTSYSLLFFRVQKSESISETLVALVKTQNEQASMSLANQTNRFRFANYRSQLVLEIENVGNLPVGNLISATGTRPVGSPRLTVMGNEWGTLNSPGQISITYQVQNDGKATLESRNLQIVWPETKSRIRQ